MIRPSDISIFWYHSHVISPISWYFRLYHAPARLGAPASRCSTSSGLAIANVLPRCWAVSGDCCSAERRRPWSSACHRMDLLQSLLTSFKFKLEFFKLDVTSSSNLWTAAHYQHIYSHLAQVGHLVVAGLPHCAQDWVTDSHTGLPQSPPGRFGFTVSLAPPDSRCDWQMAVQVVYKRSVLELVHVTARALIIEIQLHRAPLQIT
jgi:hypothetical protein